MNIKLVVATHKPYEMPSDPLYFPLHVGKDKEPGIGFQGDNTGDHISAENRYFSELTGLYWAWKNLDADYIGLAHYRRHFTCKKIVPISEKKRFDCLLTKKQAEAILKSYDIVLPKKRNYYIENLYDHYKHSLYIETLDEAGKIIAEKCPEYLPEFEKLHTRKSAHMFNMMIMSKPMLDQYCTWLFDILFELKERIDPAQYDSFHSRYPGRVAELLLDVWLNTNELSYAELSLMDMQHINWLKKCTAFLRAKLTGKKYTKSF